MKVVLFPPVDTPRAWPHLLPLVRDALEAGDGEYAEVDVFNLLERGIWHAFATIEEREVTNLAVVEVLAYPRKRVLFVHLGAGRDAPAAVTAMWPYIREFAEAHGCTLVRLFGRRGWSRVLSRTGTGADRRVKEALTLEVSP